MSTEGIDAISIKDIPVKAQIKEGQLFNISCNDVAYSTHNIHKYPAKFIPHIPRWAIKKYLKNKDNLVLDPFCGSGTTVLEAILNSQNGIGIDIDPLAILISKVKTTPIEADKILKVKNNLIEELKFHREDNFRPELETLEHWFNNKAINDLGNIRSLIEEYKDDKDIYDFLIVTMSSIIRKVSNADDQSQKTYVSHTREKSPPPVVPTFIKRLGLYSDRLIDLSEKIGEKNKVKLINGDIRYLESVWEKNQLDQVDLAITSPPYIKAIDYIYNQMAEYFWIGDIFDLENQKKQNKYKKQYIGTKQVPAAVYKGKVPKTKIEEIDSLVKKIKEKDVKHAYIVGKFFFDMKNHFSVMKNILKEESHYVFVIGNNNVNGYYVPSHKFLIECAKESGLVYNNHFGYNIRNRYMRFPRGGRGGIIKEDWVLDFSKE